MGTIRSMKSRFEALNFRQIVLISLENTKDEMIVLNRSDLLQGKLSDDDEITPGYKLIEYSLFKQEMNSLPGLGVPDLRLTGAFYRGIGVKFDIGAYTYTMFSTDEKADRLQAKYTPFIFGLNRGSKKLYAIQTLKPILLANLKNALSL